MPFPRRSPARVGAPHCRRPPSPLLSQEEYDFRNDTHNATLGVELKPSVQHRPYQEKSLGKMFGNGRARSGVIVLPCGAGKSLVGVSAAARVAKSALVLCTNAVSVDQWRYQFQLWTNLQARRACHLTSPCAAPALSAPARSRARRARMLPHPPPPTHPPPPAPPPPYPPPPPPRTLQQDHQVARFTATQREWFKGDSGVCITTYTMVAFTGRRSEESERIMQDIMGREWGVILLDEVHVVPAQVRALGGACCSRGAGWVVGCVLHCTRVRALVLATHAPSHVVARPPARPPTRSPSRARCSAACWASSRRTASWG